MKAYIKDPKTFATVKDLDLISWDVPVASTTDETGSVQAHGMLTGYEGCFLLMDRDLFIIQSASPEDDLTSFSVTSILDFFDRPVTVSGNTIGEMLAGILTSEYKCQADPLYRYEYLEIINNDHTPCSVSGVHSFKELVRSFSNTVDVRFDGRGFTLKVYISPALRPSHTVTFDGTEQLVSQTFSKDTVGKVTFEGSDYYLKKDGTVTTEMPADSERVHGEWIVSDGDTPQEIFAKNTASHKIEWMSFEKLGLYDPVRFRLNDSVYESYVTYIQKSSSDSRYRYRSGELATTLTEKIRRMK